jgi:hypothetical protein
MNRSFSHVGQELLILRRYLKGAFSDIYFYYSEKVAVGTIGNESRRSFKCCSMESIG